MLRSLVIRSSGSLCCVSRNVATRHNPSTTTSVLLTKLPSSLTESKLKQDVTAINCRKVELEPGCSLFFSNECEARIAADFLQTKRKLDAIVSRASMPSIVLQNVPETITVETLEKGFAAQNPQVVRVSGGSTVQVKFSNDGDAGKAVRAINAVQLDGQTLKACSSKISKSHQVVSVFNIPQGTDMATVKSAVNAALDAANLNTKARAEDGNMNRPTVVLRFPSSADVSKDSLEAALAQGYKLTEMKDLRKPALFLRNIAHLADQTLDGLLGAHKAHVERLQILRPSPDKLPNMAVAYFRSEQSAFECAAELHNKVVDGRRVSAAYREVTEPAVLLTNVAETVTMEELEVAAQELDGCDRFIYAEGSGSAVLVMDSPKAARLAQQFFHHMEMDEEVICAQAHEEGDVGAVITAMSPEAKLTPAAIAEALRGFESQPKSMSFQTHVRAEVGFMSVEEAHKALNSYVAGGVKLPSSGSSAQQAGSMVASSLSTLPAYVLQLSGLSPETPVQEITDALAQAAPEARVIRADRSALLKFRRHHDVVPGMKQLKTLQVDGQTIKVDRYRPLELEGDSAYDQVTGAAAKEQLAVEKFSVLAIVKDFMHLDPASRYQIAKNAFNRALYDARARKNMDALFDNTLSREALQEAAELFEKRGDAARMDAEEINQRLFQLFLQKEEMARYSADFRELTSLLGPADDSSSFNWSQFDVHTGEDVRRLLREMKEADEEALEDMVNTARRGRARGKQHVAYSGSDEESEEEQAQDDEEQDQDDEEQDQDDEEQEQDGEEEGSENEITDSDASGSDSDLTSSDVSDSDASDSDDYTSNSDSDSDSASDSDVAESDLDGENRQDVDDSKFSKSKRLQRQAMFRDEQGNVLNLTSTPNGDILDTSGNLWSMVVLNTDTTQKTMPGGRMISHRTLVMLGNMKGSGGFGMGKGKTPADSLNAACRAAMRNLLHIDLYDNFGLAHDLYGKHNACHVYIRATPASREMVASHFAEEVLNRFGISSASVKIVGNRNPYSQINALFNALSHHENIDEFAKDRGQRYLTLRWAHDKGV